MKRYLLLIGMACLTFTGCTFNSQVPRTTIQGKIAGQPFKVETPKDSELRELEISAATNGTVSVKVKELKARMNPDNIAATGAAQAAIINATGDLVLKSVEAGKAAAATVPK